jgi:hypothetical protein
MSTKTKRPERTQKNFRLTILSQYLLDELCTAKNKGGSAVVEELIRDAAHRKEDGSD